ncbi:hypothetical protein Dimus_007098 [Dionaea muscipula]
MEGPELTFPLKNTLTTTIFRQKNSSYSYLKDVTLKLPKIKLLSILNLTTFSISTRPNSISTRSYIHHGRMPKPLPMTLDAPSSQGEDEAQSSARTGTRPTLKLD